MTATEPTEPPKPPREAPTNLRGSTARGLAWTMGQAMTSRLLSLVGFVVLARLLSPRDYGLVALANVFAGVLGVLAAGGLTQAIVQRDHVDKLDLDSTFWFGLALGSGLALALSAASWPLAAVFHQPDLQLVLCALSLSLVFVALGSTPQAVLMRELRFRANAKTLVFANVIATIVGVTAAFLGFGVWALVLQVVLGIAGNAIATLVISGYRPSLQASASRAWSFFDYSRHIAGSSLMNFFNTRADDFLIGAVLGPVSLGIYTIAYRVLTIMNEVVSVTARQVAYPVFARLKNDLPRLNRAYTSAARMCSLVAMPSFLFLLVAAPEIVPTLFGDQWEESIPIMQILCLLGPLYAVMQFNAAILQSQGRARLVFWLNTAATAVQVGAFAIAVQYGIEWVAASLVIRSYLLAPIGLIIAAREMNGSVRAHLKALAAPVVGSAVTMAVLVVFRMEFDSHLGPIPMVAAMAVVALGTYAAALRLLGGGILSEAREYANELIVRKRPQPQA